LNLHSVISGVIQSVNQSFIGTLKLSAGYAYVGDAVFTGSIAGTLLTISAVTSGAVVAGSTIASPPVNPGTTVLAIVSGSGGIGTYTVSQAQSVTSTAMTAAGTGQRVTLYTEVTGLPMQVQALTAQELQHIDGLNIQGIVRYVYMNGRIEGLDRPNLMGGDILLIPTGMTTANPDVWLVTQVMEDWDAGGWSKVLVTLQAPTQSQ
jgi:hypothetical protein